MFKKIGIMSVCIYIIILYCLRMYRIINNIETILLTVICLMLLFFFNMIEVSHLSKSFGDKIALNNISFTVKEG